MIIEHLREGYADTVILQFDAVDKDLRAYRRSCRTCEPNLGYQKLAADVVVLGMEALHADSYEIPVCACT